MSRSTDDRPARAPGKRSRPGRTAERSAIRAVTAVFEDAGMVVQEVDTANDIGKDLYVDLAQDGRFTGELIALQVKAGRSYRARNGSHRLRASADDRDLWANSSVPRPRSAPACRGSCRTGRCLRQPAASPPRPRGVDPRRPRSGCRGVDQLRLGPGHRAPTRDGGDHSALAAGWPALTLLVNAVGEERPDRSAEIVPRSPALRSSDLVAELGSVLSQHGSAYLW